MENKDIKRKSNKISEIIIKLKFNKKSKKKKWEFEWGLKNLI
jgi:hypothetical protein